LIVADKTDGSVGSLHVTERVKAEAALEAFELPQTQRVP
jgi:hypothetical protein